MKNKPVVSIVLPTYNGAKYIRESLDSILAQTFQDWELIIVNDCSTDETPQIAAEYAKRDEVVIATKFLPRSQDEIAERISGKEHVLRSLDSSLSHLGMDYVDLYIGR